MQDIKNNFDRSVTVKCLSLFEFLTLKGRPLKIIRQHLATQISSPEQSNYFAFDELKANSMRKTGPNSNHFPVVCFNYEKLL